MSRSETLLIEYPYIRFQDQISILSDLSAFSFRQQKMSQCLCSTSSVDKNEWTLVSKLLSCYFRSFMIHDKTHNESCWGFQTSSVS